MAPYATTIAAQNPKRWYKFNEASGSVLDYGTDASAAEAWLNSAPTYHVAGGTTKDVNNFAVGLAGLSELQPDALVLGTTQSWECLCYPTNPAVDTQMVVNRDLGVGDGARYYRLSTHSNGSALAFVFMGGAATTLFVIQSAAGKVIANAWNHIVLTFSLAAGVTTGKLWINGALCATDFRTGSVLTTSSVVNISGTTLNSGGSRFYGRLQHLACYNLELSAADIARRWAAL